MNMPHPESNAYVRDITAMRDKALQESHFLGACKNLGIISFGTQYALWTPEYGNQAMLTHKTLDVFGQSLTTIPRTRLTIDILHKNAVEVIAFDIDLELGGIICKNTFMLNDITMLEYAKAQLSKRTETKKGLTVASAEDKVLLYNELARGASGMYPYRRKIKNS